jgi:hypothetical protein
MADETRIYLEDWFETDPEFEYVSYYYFNGQRVAVQFACGELP